MRALVLEDRPIVRDDVPAPTPAPGEVVIQVRRAGVCDTDLQLVRGYMGFRGILGHELVGTVDDPSSSLHGRRVVADINAGCGACPDCRERDGHHCPQRTVLGIAGRDGAFAEMTRMPASCLVPVPDDVPDDHAVFAEPLAAALHVLDVLPARVDDPVLVLGDGKLGLLITLALRGAGVPVRLVGHHRDKLAIAAAVGAEVALEADAPTEPAAVVVEATGSATGLARALASTRPRGLVVLKTTLAGPVSVDLSPIVIRELRVVGSRCGDMARALEQLAARAIDPTPLIAARYPLAAADEALRHAGRRGVLKVLLEIA